MGRCISYFARTGPGEGTGSPEPGYNPPSPAPPSLPLPRFLLLSPPPTLRQTGWPRPEYPLPHLPLPSWTKLPSPIGQDDLQQGPSLPPVAYLGFPRGGTPSYYLTNFSQKLHENEEKKLAQRGAVPCTTLDPPLPLPTKNRQTLVKTLPPLSLRTWSVIRIGITWGLLVLGTFTQAHPSSLRRHLF